MAFLVVNMNKKRLNSKLEKKVKLKSKDIKSICRDWGIGLIIAGIIPFIFPELLDIYVGVTALILGIITLIFRQRWNLAVIGTFIILLGATNIIVVLSIQTSYGFLILGILQILIGIGALNEYHNV